MNVNVKKYISILLLLIFSIVIQAQSGKVSGTVKDINTGDPLPGANVIIGEDNPIGTATNIQGEFLISAVPAGTSKLRVSYIGYKPYETTITVPENEIVSVNVQMGHESVKGEEVVVTAQARGQLEAINKQLTSQTISNVVSSDRIREIPDNNAAESLGRLPGINVVRSGGEGTKVSIRGLAPKYNKVQLNNVDIPGTSTSNKSVDLTMISPNMLSEIEVVKSITPDMDADAVGGVVNMRLKEAQEGLHFDAMAQGGYNEKVQSFKPYKFQLSGSNRFFDNKLGVYLQGYLERSDRGTDLLSTDWDIIKEEGLGISPLEMDDFSITDRADIRRRYGASLIADYQLPNGKLTFNSIFSQWTRERINRYENFNFGSVQHTWGIRGEEHNVYIMTNSLQGKQEILGINLDYGLSYSESDREHPGDNRLTFVENSAFKSGYSKLLEEGPDTLYTLAENDFDEANVNNLDIYDIDMYDKNFQTNLDFTIPIRAWNLFSGNIKFGGKFTTKERYLDKNRWNGPLWWDTSLITDEMADFLQTLGWPYNKGNDAPQPPFFLPMFIDEDFETGNFLRDPYKLSAVINYDHVDRLAQTIRPEIPPYFSTSHQDDYDGTEQKQAYYIMGQFDITQKLTVIPGVRYEYKSTDYNAKYARPTKNWDGKTFPRQSDRDFEYWFPSINVKYSPTNWMDFRFAKTRTITRPDYDFFVPSLLADPQSGHVTSGNPDIKPALSDNWDVGMSVYNDYVGLLGLNAFYKEVDDVFWETQTILEDASELGLTSTFDNNTWSVPVNNPRPAYIRGLEIEWQTDFWFLPKPFNNLVFNVNYTKIHSETKYPQIKVETDYSVYPPTFKKDTLYREGRMLHQPDDMANLMLGYDYKGFSVRVSWQFQGNVIREVAERPENDEYTEDYSRLDMQLKQQLPWKGLRLYMNISNLTDSREAYYQRSAVGPRRLVREEFYGRVFKVGIRYGL